MDDLELLRQEIKTQSGKVPMAVLQGSVQMVIRWKDRAVHAVRVANNPTSSKRELEIALKEITRTT
jgi:hypothetical protein